jgi:hypothetical protein
MPTRGTPKQTIRVDPDLWRRFGDVVGDRAAALRTYMAWVLREPGAKLPRRPEVGTQTDEGDHGAGSSHSAT